jgi:opacity protein-like surface antigen
MRYQHHVIFTFLGCIASVPGYARSAFDGFRLGIEATYSETAFRVDASKPKGAALKEAEASLSRGEAQLAASTAQLAKQRAAFEAGSRSLAEGRQRLRLMEEQVAASPQAAARLAPVIAQLRRDTTQGAASLQAASASILAGDQAVEAGRAQLAEGSLRAAELNTFPSVSTVTLPGTSVRVSLGWGTSWATRVGGIHLGAEIDAAPGVGDAVVRVPGRYDTRIEGGSTFGASARLGWIPVRWAMPYVIAGVETQQLHVERGSGRSTEHFTGFRMGLGVEFSVSENNIIRVGYDHTTTSDVSFAGARVTPSRDTYRLGLVRRF